MHLRLRFDEDRRVAAVFKTGAYHPDHTRAALRALDADPRLGPGWGVLFDLRGETVLPDDAELARLAEVSEAGRPQALVVAGPVQDRAARRYAALAELRGLRVGVFTDPDEALRWLDSARQQ